MRGTRRLLLFGGLLVACGTSVAAEPERVYVSGGYHWAPGYYTGGVFTPAPGYYFFAPGYYTAAPRAAVSGPTVNAPTSFPYFPPIVQQAPWTASHPLPANVAVPGHVGYYARQRIHGVNPNYYHAYLHPRSEDLGGP